VVVTKKLRLSKKMWLSLKNCGCYLKKKIQPILANLILLDLFILAVVKNSCQIQLPYIAVKQSCQIYAIHKSKNIDDSFRKKSKKLSHMRILKLIRNKTNSKMIK